MHELIKELMPQVPMFTEYFDALCTITFFAHYVSTLVECGLQPDVSFSKPEPLEPFPDAMPPIPVRKIVSFPVKVTLGDLSLASPSLNETDMNLLLNDVLNGHCFSFSKMEPMVLSAAGSAIRGKLLQFMPQAETLCYDDDEIRVPIVAGVVWGVASKMIQEMSSVPLNLWKQLFTEIQPSQNDDITKRIISAKSFDQRIIICKKEADLLLQSQTDHEKNKIELQRAQVEKKIQESAATALQKELDELRVKEAEAYSVVRSNFCSRLEALEKEANDASASITAKVNSCPQGYSVDTAQVTAARADINAQVVNQRNKINQALAEEENSIALQIRNLEYELRQTIEKKKKENLDELQVQALAEQRNLEDRAMRAQKELQDKLTKIQVDSRSMFTLLLKTNGGHVLLDGLRLSVISISNAAEQWSNTVIGGCTVSCNITPQVRAEALSFSLKSQLTSTRAMQAESIVTVDDINYWLFDVKIVNESLNGPSSRQLPSPTLHKEGVTEEDFDIGLLQCSVPSRMHWKHFFTGLHRG
ncbi:hypothetical protein Pelo_18866 [Pelomyxa schiedti]|nr:hypothetical protein Pelo_18866 [Pelomyxa schiedti]